MLDNTSLFDHKKIESALVSKTFFEVFEALEESGYNPVNPFHIKWFNHILFNF